jgi:hypothetical protein
MTIASDQEELARLRTENAELRHQNAELRRPRVVRQIVERPGFVSPTRPELDAVRQIVVRAFPFLVPESASRRATFDDEFTAAFVALSHMPRQEGLNARYTNGTWCDRASAVLRRLHHPVTDLPFAAFTAAALAHDLPHTVDPARWPCDTLFGLGDHVGRFADGAEWRRVLDRGTVRPATPMPRRPVGDALPPGLVREIAPTW